MVKLNEVLGSKTASIQKNGDIVIVTTLLPNPLWEKIDTLTVATP